MAVVDTADVTLVPLPVRGQRQALEPDGYAHAFISTVGDASGGNVLQTIRGPSSHLYFLKAISVEVDGALTQGNIEFLARMFWMEDVSGNQGDFFFTESAPQTTAVATRWMMSAAAAHNVARYLERIPLGHYRPVSLTNNGFFVASHDNVTTQVTTMTVLFEAWRREATTVSGFLEAARAGGVDPRLRR